MKENEKLIPNNCSELDINMLISTAGFVKLLHPSCKLKETLSSLKIIYLSDFFQLIYMVFLLVDFTGQNISFNSPWSLHFSLHCQFSVDLNTDPILSPGHSPVVYSVLFQSQWLRAYSLMLVQHRRHRSVLTKNLGQFYSKFFKSILN